MVMADIESAFTRKGQECVASNNKMWTKFPECHSHAAAVNEIIQIVT